MSYAVRNDMQGCRSVAGPEEVGENEFYSEVFVEASPPPKTYQSELNELNYAYQLEVDKFNRAFAVAYLSDGPSQESKQAAIRAQYEVRKTQHANDVIDLKIKYGV